MLSKLKCRGFRATSLLSYDFSTPYTTLPHNLKKKKLLDLIRWTFKRALKIYGSLCLACNDRKAFFTSTEQSRYTYWSCQNVCDVLTYLLDNIYIRFGTKLYRQIIEIPMGTKCAPLVADLFLYCYERDMHGYIWSVSNILYVKNHLLNSILIIWPLWEYKSLI